MDRIEMDMRAYPQGSLLAETNFNVGTIMELKKTDPEFAGRFRHFAFSTAGCQLLWRLLRR